MAVEFVKDVYEMDAETTKQIPDVSILKQDIVRVELHTKDLKGLSFRDLELANIIDAFDYEKYKLVPLMKEKGYKTINIIADLTIVHNSFFEVFSYHMKALKTRNWDVLQYCCLDHKHTEQIQELDIDFYAKTNPDLGTTEIPCIRHHWNNYGILQGRVGAPHMVPTTSNNTLAFGLKNTVFSSIEKNIQTALGSKIEVGIFDFHGQNVQKLMMIPNLFILPKTGTQVCKTLRWHLSFTCTPFKRGCCLL